MHHFKPNYFPALDGLRGLAILLVIAHHQLIPVHFAGGFLGVDLFFALSGFLITTLLLAEFETNQTISLKNFYVRRVLRLAPALITYLVAVLLLTYAMRPEEFSRELKLVGLAIGYATNWRMALGWNTSLDPTAIIWSLSIEEQFYLVWPVVLLLCLSLRVKRIHIICGLGLVILGVMAHRSWLWSHGAELSRLYYGTDTRADAPLCGCLLALTPKTKLSWLTRRVGRRLSLIAVTAFAYLIVTSHYMDSFLYRGGYTGIALLAAFITWSAANAPTSAITKTLSWYPLRWFGKISYGLYLWHWLMLQDTSFYFWSGTLDPWIRCAATIAIAAISFYFVEAPFHQLKSLFSKPKQKQSKVREKLKTPIPAPLVVQPSENV